MAGVAAPAGEALMFKTIVCATDGSGHASKAVAIAADLAARYQARLVIVHAVAEGDIPAELQRMAEVEHLVGPADADHPSRVAHALVQKVLDDAAADVGQKLGSDLVTHLETGDPARVILRAVERERADLVVMGSRGLGEIKGLLQGSVSHKIAQLAPCPCLTVK
jgi:nucleotide-binding universal stress UspA family protein